MKKSIFIIDDDVVYMKFIREHFSVLGDYNVKVFYSGGEALRALKNSKPYLIILDHLFNEEPEKTGINYLDEIYKLYPRVPVIYLTASRSEPVRRHVTERGVFDYIIKDDAFLVYLRTALDKLEIKQKRKSFFRRILGV
jgi:DNA-binding NtrC family response regulator